MTTADGLQADNNDALVQQKQSYKSSWSLQSTVAKPSSIGPSSSGRRKSQAVSAPHRGPQSSSALVVKGAQSHPFELPASPRKEARAIRREEDA